MKCLPLYEQLDTGLAVLREQKVNDNLYVVLEGPEHGGEFWALDDVTIFGRINPDDPDPDGDSPALVLTLGPWKRSVKTKVKKLRSKPTVGEIVTKPTTSRKATTRKNGGGAA